MLCPVHRTRILRESSRSEARTRLCLSRAHLILAALATASTLLCAGPALAAGQPEPLENFRRVQMLVPHDFDAKCKTSRGGSVCTISSVPDDFSALMYGLRGGRLAAVTLENLKQGRARIRFKLKRSALRFQHAVLRGPSRWVVEVGLPTILLDEVQDQLPFRPYPLKPTTMIAEVPPPNLFPLPPKNDANREFNACYANWRAHKLAVAMDLCTGVVKDHPKTRARRAAIKLIAECKMLYLDPSNTDNLPTLTRALMSAEKAADSLLEASRYVLLMAIVLEKLGYLNRAELHLSTDLERYRGTLGESYMLAGRARILMRLGDTVAARKMLEKLRQLPGTAPTVGGALLALAELGYSERSFVVSVGLFDVVRARWPQLMDGDVIAHLQSGELFLKYGRLVDAKRHYTIVKERFAGHPKAWLATLRLTEILAYSDAEAARDQFRDLATDIKSTEGQDMAFIRYARMAEKASERRRIIRNLARGKSTEYVLSELTVQAMQQSLDDGRLDDAYEFGWALWRRRPDALILKEASNIFDRALFMVVRQHAMAGRHYAVLRTYYADRQRFEVHRLRGEIHLLAGQSLRALAMHEEAVRVLQSGLGGRTAALERSATARLYRQMAAVLWENGDQYRLGEILDYLDARFPKRFDDFDYWMARAHRSWWDGKIEEAREIFLYALNGPMTNEQELDIIEILADFYLQNDKVDEGIKALQSQIRLHDKIGKPMAASTRRNARWRLVELHFDREEWAASLAGIDTFLSEYPDDPERFEARFIRGRIHLREGDEENAIRTWDLVAREDGRGLFGKLAKMELQLVRWRRDGLRDAADRAGL
jgi:tetratricopeptide (TPR) repeat protein